MNAESHPNLNIVLVPRFFAAHGADEFTTTRDETLAADATRRKPMLDRLRSFRSSTLTLSRGAAVLVVVALTAAGCGESQTETEAPSATRSAKTPAAEEAAPRAARVVRAHLAAVGGKNRTDYLKAVADDASFDIGGRALDGRGAIGAFFDAELSGGRYEIVREQPSPDGVTFDVNFRRGELSEALTYRYTVRAGRIATLVATYR